MDPTGIRLSPVNPYKGVGGARWLEGGSLLLVHTYLVLAVSPLLCKVLYILCGCLLAPPGEVVSHPMFEGIGCVLGHYGELEQVLP